MFDKSRVIKNDGRIDKFYFTAINDELVIWAIKGDQVSIIKPIDQE